MNETDDCKRFRHRDVLDCAFYPRGRGCHTGRDMVEREYDRPIFLRGPLWSRNPEVCVVRMEKEAGKPKWWAVDSCNFSMKNHGHPQCKYGGEEFFDDVGPFDTMEEALDVVLSLQVAGRLEGK